MKNQKLDSGKVYRNTELLLENYRNIIWRLEESLEDVESTLYYMGGRHLSNLFHLLFLEVDEYDQRRNRIALEERLFSLQDSKIIIEAIDNSMLKLKKYPVNGEKYFLILHAAYIDKEPIHQDEIQDRLLVSNSTFYRNKKKALEILDGILWGYLKPYLQEMRQVAAVSEDVDTSDVTAVPEDASLCISDVALGSDETEGSDVALGSEETAALSRFTACK